MSAVLLAGAAGGIPLIYFTSWLLGKTMTRIPVKPRIIYSAIAACVLAVVVGGFGAADGGSWNPSSWPSYVLATAIVIPIRLYAAKRKETAGTE